MVAAVHISEEPVREDVAAVCAGAEDGADLIFLGRVRATEAGLPITHLFYEAYQPMADNELHRIVSESATDCREVHVVHRIGKIPVGEIAIGVRVLSRHRREAIRFLEFFMDRLKTDVPIWKIGSMP